METVHSQKRVREEKTRQPYKKRRRLPGEDTGLASTLSSQALMIRDSLDGTPANNAQLDSTGLLPTQAQNITQDYDSLCKVCGEINFDSWLNAEAIPALGHLCSLKHIHNLSNCRLCRFFTSLCLACGQPAADIKKCRIAIGRTTSVFGAKILPYSPCFRLFKGSKDVNGTILLYTQKSVESPGVSARFLQRDKIEQDLVKSWLQFCDSSHGPLCKTGILATIPGLKVIDCRSGNIVPFSSQLGDFVTLSYVWGTSSQIHSVVNAFLPQHIPKVVADAILVTQTLGFQYLWVDRYCIPQGDHADRDFQIANMGSIYKSSSLTIIAAAGNGPEYGLPGVNGTLRTEQLRVKLGQSVLVHYVDATKEVQSSKWNSRGWTYQEGMLSRRRLIFTECQVFFQCLSMHCIESISYPLGTLHNSRNVFQRDIRQAVFPSSFNQRSPPQLMYRINDFIQRDLSVDEDAINAMKGILSLFRNLKAPVRHLCGLPVFSTSSFRTRNTLSITGRLATALGWGGSSTLLRRPAFPSWSWPGWKRSRAKLESSKLLVYFPLLRHLLEDASYVGKQSFHSPLQIKAEFGDGNIYDWKSNSELVMDLSEFGNHPRYLHIYGWTFRIPITRQNSKWQIAPNFPWNTHGELHILRLPDEHEHEVYEDSEQNVLGLVLSVEEPRSNIGFLILYPISNASAFERLGVFWATNEETPSELLKINKLNTSCIMRGIQLEWNEIYLA